MQQEVELSRPNKDGLYSKIIVTSIYKKNDELIFFITFLKKKPDEEAPLELKTKVSFENGADEKLNIRDAFLIFPKDGINKIAKCYRTEVDETIHGATWVYGRNMRTLKTHAVANVNRLPWLNITWLHRSIFSMQNVIWGASGLGAIAGLFAVRLLGNNEPDVLPKNGPSVKV